MHFSQGLAFTEDGVLLESTGLYDGRSSIRRVDMKTGNVLYKSALDNSLFGEGIAVAEGKVFMLTWRSDKGFVYDATTLALTQEFKFSTGTGEGWGITYDGTHLIVSDGSAMLYFWDVDTLKEVRRVQVTETNSSGQLVTVPKLNELEFIRGQVWANIWYQNRIVRIDTDTGGVRGTFDCRHLLTGLNADADVFNGVALMPVDPTAGGNDDIIQVAVTGKFWDTLYVLNVSLDDLAD
jgi:glutamine cyclotransferase